MRSTIQRPTRPLSSVPGFTLIVTVTMLVLLSLVAIGLLSLSTVSVRAAQRGQHEVEARANARLALMLALGDLQRELGPDQRISANASILDSTPETPALDGVGSPELVGVWDAYSAGMSLAEASAATAPPNYDEEQLNRFRRWLISHPDPTAPENREGVESDETMALFAEERDGFDLAAPLVPLQNGAYSWAVLQENTKAKVLPASYSLAEGAARPDDAENDVLVAPQRTGLALSGGFETIDEKETYEVANKILSTAQLEISPLAGSDYGRPETLRDFTVHSAGVLSDVARGGLKLDLSHAFELPDGQFETASFDGTPNPLLDRDDSRFDGERPLFQPGRGFAPAVLIQDPYTTATLIHEFRAGHLPTFHTLRSHYRLYHHLYESEQGLTAYERPLSGAGWSDASESRTQLMPMLDRMLFFLQANVDRRGGVELLFTPLITLWNPHNVAIECDGFTAYPWLDVPLNVVWNGQSRTGGTVSANTWLSGFLGSGDTGEGRTKQPYFYLKMTADGTEAPSRPIAFQPGEVKVFSLTDNVPRTFNRTGNFQQRTWHMKPVESIDELHLQGGVSVSMARSMWGEGSEFHFQMTPGSRLQARIEYTRGAHKYHVSLEDMGRWDKANPEVQSGTQIANVQVDVGFSGQGHQTLPFSPWITQAELSSEPYPLAVMETFHGTARGGDPAIGGGKARNTDLVGITNPRQPYVSSLLAGDLINYNIARVSHYDTVLREITDIVGAGIELTLDARRSYYGESNSASTGRDYLVFAEVPRAPALSLAAFQHADLSNGTFAPMNQFGNSWASPYTSVPTVHYHSNGRIPIRPRGQDYYDFSYLTNEALWDRCFLSGAAPDFSHRGTSGSGESAYDSDQISISRSLPEVLEDFVENPVENPLRNGRHLLYPGGLPEEDLKDLLSSPEGFRHMAAHLLVDGAFNVNSTSVEAWQAVLSSTRDAEFTVHDHDGASSFTSRDRTPLSRNHHPSGNEQDPWNGFRTLEDSQIEALAENIVEQVKLRGPFLSLAEFVNRRLEASSLGISGALQSAIDATSLNSAYRYDPLVTTAFKFRRNFTDPHTGVGTPGYLTQADVLQSLGPFLTVRSDTFVVRTCGESRDSTGQVLARACCEAVVQRVPTLIDPSQDPATTMADLNAVNERFGRRLVIKSFRWLNVDAML